MASGAAIRSKIARALGRLNVTSRTVMLRSVMSSGGNPVLGLGQSVSSTDVVVDPQPAVELIAAEEVAAAKSLLQLGDYRLTFAGTLTENTLKNSEILYGTDVLKVIRYDPIAIDGTVVAWSVIARVAKA